MIAGIILAGGKGSRFGAQKQFLEIQGKPLWKHVCNKLEHVIDRTDIVVVGVDVEGGITRSESVRNGLCALQKNNKPYSKVIILEAARPLITIEQIDRIINAPHDSCTYALPLTSTVIMKNGTYLNRDELYKMATPVAFNYPLFTEAYLSGKYHDYTDDTRVMYEHYGIKPYFLEGGENLLKVTYSTDLLLLELLMKKYDL